MISVDEVDVGVTGRAEYYRVPRRAAGSSVRGGIFFTEISFDFDDACGEASTPSFFPDQHLAQKSPCHAPRIARKELTAKGMDLASVGWRLRLGHEAES